MPFFLLFQSVSDKEMNSAQKKLATKLRNEPFTFAVQTNKKEISYVRKT